MKQLTMENQDNRQTSTESKLLLCVEFDIFHIHAWYMYIPTGERNNLSFKAS